MVNVKNITDVPNDYLGTTTDGYPDTSARAYQMGMDQDMNTDEHGCIITPQMSISHITMCQQMMI